MYTISGYGEMIADRHRMAPYAAALKLAVKQDSVVLDIGTGTGIFSLLACQFGARKVYAIEPGDAIQAAREIAKANGFSDRIEFINEFSDKVDLPQRADVIISDLRGVLPLFQKHIPTIIDARNRFLAPGGCLIPSVDTIFAAVVNTPESYKYCLVPWQDNEFGFDMQAASQLVANTWYTAKVTPDQIVLPAKTFAVIDYRTVTTPNVKNTLHWEAQNSETVHGLLLWFDALLAENITFSNGPGKPDLIYGKAFFPFSRPIDLVPGDNVYVTIKANLVGEDYIWLWDTLVENNVTRQKKADYRQSTFMGSPVALENLRKQSSRHIPELSSDGIIDLFIMQNMQNNLSLTEIAEKTLEKFPREFSDLQQALTRVGSLSQKYSR